MPAAHRQPVYLRSADKAVGDLPHDYGRQQPIENRGQSPFSENRGQRKQGSEPLFRNAEFDTSLPWPAGLTETHRASDLLLNGFSKLVGSQRTLSLRVGSNCRQFVIADSFHQEGPVTRLTLVLLRVQS